MSLLRFLLFPQRLRFDLAALFLSTLVPVSIEELVFNLASDVVLPDDVEVLL